MQPNNTAKKENLTRQSLFLIAGKVVSLPVTFLIPVILTRQLSMEEFGHYKQLFILFSILIPFLDFGIAQGLIYFLPRRSDESRKIITNYLFFQTIISLIAVVCLIAFNRPIAFLLTQSYDIAKLIPLMGGLVAIWALSANLEILFTTEKRTNYSGLFIFLSEGCKGVLVITVALSGGKLLAVLLAFLVTGGLRLVWLGIYLLRQGVSPLRLSLKTSKELLIYSLPLGVAVCINAFIEYSHQIIVSHSLTASDFAIYSIGCFQLPIIAVMTMSVSMVIIVRIGEMTEQESRDELDTLLANSFRKLALLFFPLFLLLEAAAEPFITTLYTTDYIDSVSVFRAFILILPLSTLLVEYIPRAQGDSLFTVKVNIATLLVNVLAVTVLLYTYGAVGAALGFVFSTIFRKTIIFWYMRKKFHIGRQTIIPYKAFLRIFICSLLSTLPGWFLTSRVQWLPIVELASHFVLFFPICLLFFWQGGILLRQEKNIITHTVRQNLQKLLPTLSR